MRYPWIWVSLPHATFGLDIRDGVIFRAPPIAKYAIGWTPEKAVTYFEKRGAEVEMYEAC